jgi:hypothetical protein
MGKLGNRGAANGIYADTIGLMSLYANDAHTPRLMVWLAAYSVAIAVTPLTE